MKEKPRRGAATQAHRFAERRHMLHRLQESVLDVEVVVAELPVESANYKSIKDVVTGKEGRIRGQLCGSAATSPRAALRRATTF